MSTCMHAFCIERSTIRCPRQDGSAIDRYRSPSAKIVIGTGREAVVCGVDGGDAGGCRSDVMMGGAEISPDACFSAG